VWINGDIASRAAALLETSIQLSDYRDKLLEILPEGYTVKSRPSRSSHGTAA